MELDLAPATPEPHLDPQRAADPSLRPDVSTRSVGAGAELGMADVSPQLAHLSSPMAQAVAASQRAIDGAGAGLSAQDLAAAQAAQAQMLTQVADARAPQNPDPDPRAVARATEEITERLSRSGTDWAVTNNDLRVIQRTLQTLPAVDATATVGNLSDAQIDRWTQQVQADLPRSEHAGLYTVLAQRLDGEQLARFSESMAPGRDGDAGQTFGRAVGRAAEPAVRLGFLREIDGQIGSDRDATQAAAEVVASLRGGALRAGLAGLDGAELRAVIQGSVSRDVDVYSMGHSASTIIDVDAETTERLLTAIATSSSPDVRARTVDAAAGLLSEFGEDRPILNALAGISELDASAARSVQDGITRILASDPRGVVATLEQSVDRQGHALTAYVKSMIESGRSDEVGRLLTSIGTDRGRAEPLDSFTQQERGDDGRPYFANAQTLGYAVGSLYAAVESISDDRRAQADVLKTIFGTAGGLAGAGGTAAGLAGTVLSGASTAVIDQVTGDLRAGDIELREALVRLAYPHSSGAARRPYNGAAEPAFDATVGRVLDNRR